MISTRRFLRIAALVLSFTAAIKGLSLFGKQAVLGAPDPLLQFLTVRQILLVAAALEVSIGLLAVSRAPKVAKLIGLGWLCLLFGAYRVALRVIGFSGYCRCLGEWPAWTHLDAAKLNAISLLLLIFLFTGSVLGLLAEVRSTRSRDIGHQPVPAR